MTTWIFYFLNFVAIIFSGFLLITENVLFMIISILVLCISKHLFEKRVVFKAKGFSLIIYVIIFLIVTELFAVKANPINILNILFLFFHYLLAVLIVILTCRANVYDKELPLKKYLKC